MDLETGGFKGGLRGVFEHSLLKDFNANENYEDERKPVNPFATVLCSRFCFSFFGVSGVFSKSLGVFEGFRLGSLPGAKPVACEFNWV